MTRAYVLVEGQTEETFIKRVLGPHLAARGVSLTPILVVTRRVKDGRKFKGGVTRYEPVRRDLLRLLGDRGAGAVTTMFDLYALPEDFPWIAEVRGESCYERVARLEEAWRSDLGELRFRPYLSLHEFEALVLVDPVQLEIAVPGAGAADRLVEEALQFSSPEEFDEGSATHPAARILRHIPGYKKALHGPLVVERIGLFHLRRRCPHLDEWVSWLESLSPVSG